MFGDTHEVSQDEAAVSEDRQVSSGSPERIVGGLLVERSPGELGEGQYLETLGVHGRDAPVLRPALEVHVGHHLK